MTITEFYVFGSVVEGTVDPESDLDVLAVTARGDYRERLPHTWCVYTPERLQQIFERGTLFAWHLHQSAVQVWPRSRRGLLTTLGAPAPYTGATAEIAALVDIALDAVGELIRGTPSRVYEMGLLYLTSRDVAMAAAPAVLKRFEFSRNAPLMYDDPLFPLSAVEYEHLMKCRRAGTRGVRVVPDAVVSETVQAKAGDLINWLRNLHARTIDGSVCSEDAIATASS